MILSAEDVLHKYLDLKGLTPNLNHWDEAHLSDNPPRLYRLKQLKILFELYSLENFADFEKGEFIKKNKIEEYNPIMDKANLFAKEYDPEHYEWLGIKKEQFYHVTLQSLFKNLFSYRCKLNNTLSHNDGVIECSGLYRYAYYLIENFNHIINNELYRIDDVLSMIISPSEQTFSMNELISKYGYPDIDIREIDSDWI